MTLPTNKFQIKLLLSVFSSHCIFDNLIYSIDVRLNKPNKTLTVLVPFPDLVVEQARAYAKHNSDGKEGEHNNNPNGQGDQAICVRGKLDITGQ